MHTNIAPPRTGNVIPIAQRSLRLAHPAREAARPDPRGRCHVTRAGIAIGSKYQPPARPGSVDAEELQRALLAQPRRALFDITRNPDLFVALVSLNGLLGLVSWLVLERLGWL